MICLITASSSLVPNSFSSVAFDAPLKLPWAPCLRIVSAVVSYRILNIRPPPPPSAYVAAVACHVAEAGAGSEGYHEGLTDLCVTKILNELTTCASGMDLSVFQLSAALTSSMKMIKSSCSPL